LLLFLKVSAEQNILSLEVEALRLQQRLDTQSGAGAKEKEGLDNEVKQLEGQVRWKVKPTSQGRKTL
jgi:hypothetical protein